jgi:hypothetical protein
MPELLRCPYCNQPLLNKAAIQHLHDEEEKVRAKLVGEANAAASRMLQAELAAAEKRIRGEVELETSEREQTLNQTIEQLTREKKAVEVKTKKAMADAEKRIRSEVELETSEREQTLNQTIEELTREKKAVEVKTKQAMADAEQELARQKKDLEAKTTKAVADAEKRIRSEVGREDSKRERRLQRTIQSLRNHNEDLERQLAGQTAQGEGAVNEQEIARDLREAWHEDEVTLNCAAGDINQAVYYRKGQTMEKAGTIVYECKNTTRWSNDYIRQVKRDAGILQTPYLMLISKTLPARETGACVSDGVIVADREHARHLVRILRRMMIETHRAELAGQDRERKTARLYEYLRGDEFRTELTVVVAAGKKLTAMLQDERKEHARTWTKRQNAYDELSDNSAAIEQAIRTIIETEEVPADGRVHEGGRRRLRAPRSPMAAITSSTR